MNYSHGFFDNAMKYNHLASFHEKKHIGTHLGHEPVLLRAQYLMKLSHQVRAHLAAFGGDGVWVIGFDTSTITLSAPSCTQASLLSSLRADVLGALRKIPTFGQVRHLRVLVHTTPSSTPQNQTPWSAHLAPSQKLSDTITQLAHDANTSDTLKQALLRLAKDIRPIPSL